jgi:hypothetical protein
MKTNNQTILNAIVERCKERKASAYTERLTVNGVEYAYMSEVDPHCDEPMGDERVWTITFVAVKPGYFFIYHLDGERFCVEPELDKPYQFNFTELHALLKKKNVKHFDNESIWDNEIEPDKKLACIFTIG